MSSIKKRGEDLANKIVTTFKNKSYTLRFLERSHLMVRLYRTTRNKDFLTSITEAFLIEKDQFIQDLNHANNKEYVNKRSNTFLKNLKRQEGIKNLKKSSII